MVSSWPSVSYWFCIGFELMLYRRCIIFVLVLYRLCIGFAFFASALYWRCIGFCIGVGRFSSQFRGTGILLLRVSSSTTPVFIVITHNMWPLRTLAISRFPDMILSFFKSITASPTCGMIDSHGIPGNPRESWGIPENPKPEQLICSSPQRGSCSCLMMLIASSIIFLSRKICSRFTRFKSCFFFLGMSGRAVCVGQNWGAAGTNAWDKIGGRLGEMRGTNAWDNCVGQMRGTNAWDKINHWRK